MLEGLGWDGGGVRMGVLEGLGWGVGGLGWGVGGVKRGCEVVRDGGGGGVGVVRW